MNLDLYHPPDEDYLPFQSVDIATMFSKMQNVLLANEMGTGKTIEGCGLINLMKPDVVLIVCPNNLRFNWLNEIARWVSPEVLATHSGLDQIEMCTTSAYIPHTFVIASFEGMTRWVAQLKQMFDGCTNGLMIIDEMHFVKNQDTKRCKALMEFKDIPNVKKIGMTGTPIPNYPYELYNLINFLAPKQWDSRKEFERRYCPYKNKYAYHMDELQDLLRHGQTIRSVDETYTEYVVREDAANDGPVGYYCSCNKVPFASFDDASTHLMQYPEHQMERAQMTRKMVRAVPVERTKTRMVRAPGVMIRRLKKEVLPDLPRKRRQVIELPAEGRLLELVLKEKEMWAEASRADKALDDILIGDIKENDEDYERKIESLRFTRKYFFDEIAIIRHELAKAKVPYVIEHIEELLETKEKLVVFIHHRDVGEAIRHHFASRAVLVYGGMSQDQVYAAKEKFWTDDSCELLIGSLKMAGVGLNLQVASNIVFAELDWVPGTITQAEDRCHRIGQENALLIQHLVARDSMDSNMAQRIIRKQKTINVALNPPKVVAA